MRVQAHARTGVAAGAVTPSKHPVPVGPPYKFGSLVVHVVCDPGMNVTAAQARNVATRVAHAWQWDKEQLHDSPQTAAPLTVQVTRGLGAGAGFTVDANTLQVNQLVLKSPDDNVFAHELSHVWDGRHGAAAWETIPTYLQEGRACLLGDRFDWAHSERDTWMEGERKTLSNDSIVTPAFVKRVFADKDSVGETYNGELVGELFVEFLRTRLSGHGVDGTVPKLAELTRRTGAGEPYLAVFKDEFGTSLADAQAQFLQYLARTKGNPRQRFAGTIFAP